jgi:hypothetical protein
VNVVIGCPVRDRGWILPRWFSHAALAAEIAGVEAEYMFVMADGDPSLDVIAENCPGEFTVVPSGERFASLPAPHKWNPSRYREMAHLRNRLLAEVRKHNPDYFLSLDSDILLHEDSLANLIETAESGWDAVGGKCWMSETRDHCSYITLLNSQGMIRPEVSTVIPVDVIMAIKLMGPRALKVDYIFDALGEDVGWSRAVAAKGLKIAFDGRVCSKHIMYQTIRGRNLMDEIDPRVGF